MLILLSMMMVRLREPVRKRNFGGTTGIHRKFLQRSDRRHCRGAAEEQNANSKLVYDGFNFTSILLTIECLVRCCREAGGGQSNELPNALYELAVIG